MQCSAIDNPANCEIRAVIRFLRARYMNVAEIHRELCAVYGQEVMGVECSKIGEQIFTAGHL
jgi:hypothetical protein